MRLFSDSNLSMYFRSHFVVLCLAENDYIFILTWTYSTLINKLPVLWETSKEVDGSNQASYSVCTLVLVNGTVLKMVKRLQLTVSVYM